MYGYRDRFRGVSGTRMVVFMNQADIAARGMRNGDLVDLETASGDGIERIVRGFRIVAYDLPIGVAGAYFPEANPLVPLGLRDRRAHTPAYKAIPIRVRAASMIAGEGNGHGQ